jgi:hypothetical protein
MMSTFVFLSVGGGIVMTFGLLGHRLIRFFEFKFPTRSRVWGALADWAAANEAAADYRLAVRRERPWREWKEGVR